MFLELAENANDYLQQNDELYLDQNGELVEGEETLSPYVFVPGQQGDEGVYVREDYFDDLPDEDWDRLMIYLEANQPGMSLFGLGAKGRARRQERRARRQERKVEKIGARARGRAGVARAGGGLGGILGGIFGGGAGAPVEGEELRLQKKKPVWPWIVAIGGGGLLVVALAGGFKKRKR